MPSLARLLFIAAVAVFVAGRPLPHGTEPSPKQPSSAQKGRPSGASPKQPSSPQNGKPSVASANQPDKDHGKGGDIVDDILKPIVDASCPGCNSAHDGIFEHHL